MGRYFYIIVKVIVGIQKMSSSLYLPKPSHAPLAGCFSPFVNLSPPAVLVFNQPRSLSAVASVGFLGCFTQVRRRTHRGRRNTLYFVVVVIVAVLI